MVGIIDSSSGIIRDDVRAALVIAHPGHELCLYGWLKQARPHVFILTDGSGHSGSSRIERTTDILKEVGAQTGSFYGRFNDVAIYEALLNHQFDLFINLAQELAAEIVREGINCVVGDAREGYNPTHDVCRLLIDSAVEIASRASAREIDNLQFLVASKPDGKPRTAHAQPIRINLDEAIFEQKLMAARHYYELQDEVDKFIRAYSEEAFRTEYLYPVNNGNGDGLQDLGEIYYEQHGARRVEQGYYQQVIRYHKHVLPLERRLNQVAKK